MREIKFRAKRIDNGRWVYGQYFKTPLTDENSGTLPEAGWFFLSGEPRHCIVQDGVSFVIDVETLSQYIGINDINGKGVYEGDILEFRNIVTYVDGTDPANLGMEVGFYSQRDNFESWRLLEVGEELEVLGNIFENQELLN